MALTVTSLNGAITRDARSMTLTAFTNPATGPITAPTMALVDGEAVFVTETSFAPSVGIARGMAGTLAVAHNTLAPVIYGLTSDFTQGANGATTAQTAPVWSYGVDSTMTNPTVNATIYIDKATAAALTLTDPAKDQQNTVTVISRTAAAHTITYATGFYDNTTSSDVATFAAVAGASMVFAAQGGKWRPLALTNVTLA
jgi:hypothetical protein